MDDAKHYPLGRKVNVSEGGGFLFIYGKSRKNQRKEIKP
jgi:hypothetical protein